MTIPANSRVPFVREAAQWRRDEAAHAARAEMLTAAHRERRAAGSRHPIDDFLYDYYGTRPGQLRRWHPGAGVVLRPATGEPPAEHASWRWYDVDDGGAVTLDVDAFLAERGDTIAYIRTLLLATASRPAFVGCLGLHEWAMVYRVGDTRRRHDLPLRLGQAGTDAVVESHAIGCTHVDAFRFFAPDAVALNAHAPTRQTQVLLEQPGCLHANMDLLKWAQKLGPAVPGEVLLDCFELARDIRTLDMQASPYDVSSLGEQAVAIETQAGKATYVTRQRAFAGRAAELRRQLIEVIDGLLPR
ncbi:MAG: 3-methyladenine DNA glycosylase [Cellulomonas sp.]